MKRPWPGLAAGLMVLMLAGSGRGALADLPPIRIQGSGTATFAHPFSPGDLPAGMGLAIGDRAIQVDPKAFHPDGSVRHALLASPAIAGQMRLAPRAACSPLDAAKRLIDAAWPFEAEVNGTRISLVKLLRRDLEAGTLDIWRACPLVSEYRVRQRIDTSLEAIFDIQAFADGSASVTMTLDRGFVDALDAELSYRVTYGKIGGGTGLDAGSYTHWGKTRWWRTYWTGPAPTAHAEHSPVYLTRTGATPRFDTGVDVIIPDVTKSLAELPVGPMQAPFNKLNMPSTGQTANHHIGLMPSDNIRYLLKPDPNLLRIIEGYALGAASIGWFWRDFNGRMVLQTPEGGLERGISKTGKWKVDEAHQPAFFYAPYLFTGHRVYLDGLHHQTNSNLHDRRGNLLAGQRRAVAWKVRNLANAAYITPDEHALKGYFTGHLTRTMEQWHRDYVLDGLGTAVSGEIKGFHLRCMSRKADRGRTSPWQEDYITLVVGWLAEMQVPLAREVLAYRANFTLGRFENHPGWHPYQGAAYRLGVMDPETCKPSQGISAWKDVWSRPEPKLSNGKSHRAGHYFDLAFGAVKTVDNILRTERSARTVAFMHRWATERANGKKSVFKEWPKKPKWAIRRRE